jgi:hypothetical protein
MSLDFNSLPAQAIKHRPSSRHQLQDPRGDQYRKSRTFAWHSKSQSLESEAQDGRDLIKMNAGCFDFSNQIPNEATNEPIKFTEGVRGISSFTFVIPIPNFESFTSMSPGSSHPQRLFHRTFRNTNEDYSHSRPEIPNSAWRSRSLSNGVPKLIKHLTLYKPSVTASRADFQG